MLLLKACPHCHGDLALYHDPGASYLECLQCGHTLSTEQERALGVRAASWGLAHIKRRKGSQSSDKAQSDTQRQRAEELTSTR